MATKKNKVHKTHLNPCQKNAQAFLTAWCRAGTASSGRSHTSEDFPFLSTASLGSDVTNMAEAGCDNLSFTSRWRGWKDHNQIGFLTDSSPSQSQTDSVRIQLSHPRDTWRGTEEGSWRHPWLRGVVRILIEATSDNKHQPSPTKHLVHN